MAAGSDYATRAWTAAAETSKEIDSSILTLSSSLLVLSVTFFERIGSEQTGYLLWGWWLLVVAVALTFLARGISVFGNARATRADLAGEEEASRYDATEGQVTRQVLFGLSVLQVSAFTWGLVQLVLFGSANL